MALLVSHEQKHGQAVAWAPRFLAGVHVTVTCPDNYSLLKQWVSKYKIGLRSRKTGSAPEHAPRSRSIRKASELCVARARKIRTAYQASMVTVPPPQNLPPTSDAITTQICQLRLSLKRAAENYHFSSSFKALWGEGKKKSPRSW